jgi:ABC-type branched-subunit amino acid transport system ATPase component
VVAVNDVTLEIRQGETVGLIGPNGAGKTTLFEVLSGFTKADAGEVWYAGRRLNRRVALPAGLSLGRSVTPERRARRGLIRSFQDAALFPTMTVEEVVMLALERAHPTTLFASVVGSQEMERPKRTRARELVAMMGLDSHRGKPVSALSTGTRRVVELCCMIALSPRLLLLDEPSSGIAQRETEALGELLRRVKQHLGATLVIIEHDIPMIMSLADRIVAMESGRIIADGTPASVRSNELVIESYLGGDVTAIERSGPRRALRPEAAAPA